MTEAAAAGESVARLSPVAQRDWRLWVDWCTATERDPGEPKGEALAAFMAELPATTAVQDRRLRNIHRAAGHTPADLPRPRTTVPARLGSPWLSYPDALGALRHEWFPEGVAARRDALILVLGAYGFTRQRIRRLHHHAVQGFPDFVIDGLALPPHTDPALCGRCALTRWLAILDAYRHRSGRDIEDLLTDARAHLRPRHDCHDLLADGWKTSPWLIPAIDKHGGIAHGQPLTTRALTGIFTRRFTPGPTQPAPALPAEVPPREIGHRPTPEEQDDIARLYDRIDAEADALNARISRLLVEIAPQSEASHPSSFRAARSRREAR